MRLSTIARLSTFIALLCAPTISSARFAENYAITREVKAKPFFDIGTRSAFGRSIPERLTDGRTTGDQLKTDLAVGWKVTPSNNEPYEAVIDLGSVRKDIEAIELDCITDPQKGLLAPDSIKVEGSTDAQNYQLWGNLTPEARPAPAVVRWRLQLPKDGQAARLVKLTLNCKSNAGVGEKCLLTEARVLRADIPNDLDGYFYQISFRQHWTSERLAKEMDWLRDIGADTLMLCSGVTSTTAFYPMSEGVLPDVKPYKNQPSGNPFEKILTAADERKMNNMFMLCNEDSAYFQVTKPEFFKNLSERTCKVFDDMYAQYKKHPSLAGVYVGIEFWYPAPMSLMKTWVSQCLDPMTKHITEVEPKYKCVAAPFAGVESRHNAKEFEENWDYMFANTPQLKMFQWQDGIGANEGDEMSTGGRTFAYMQEMWTMLKRCTDKYNRELWVDAEFFDKVGGPYPPHFSRVRDQLASAAPFCDGAVGFEWAYLSPGASVSAAGEFYQNYMRWHMGKPWLENIAWKCPYTTSESCEEKTEAKGIVKKLTDNDRDGLHEGRRYVYWENVTKPLEVTIDLQHQRTGIEGFAAALRTEKGNGMVDESIEVSVSKDNSQWTTVGVLKPNSTDDNEMNVHQLFDLEPVTARYVRFVLTPSKEQLAQAGKDKARIALCELGVFSTVNDIVSLNKPYLLIPAPADKFPDETGKMTNGDNTTLWYGQCGYYDQKTPVTVTIDLTDGQDAGIELNRLQTMVLRNEKHGTVLPSAVRVELSNDGKTWSAPIPLEMVDYGDRQNVSFEKTLDTKQTATKAKFTFEPPTEKGWMLISETRVMNLSE